MSKKSRARPASKKSAFLNKAVGGPVLLLEPVALSDLDEKGADLLQSTGPVRARIDNVKSAPGGRIEARVSMRLDVVGAIANRSPDPKFDPWVAATEDALRYPGGLKSPEFAAHAIALCIANGRHAIEHDGVTLLSAVNMILQNRMTAPAWLASAFAKAWGAFERFEAHTLDEAFGHLPADPRSTKARRKNRLLMPQVHKALCDEVRDNPSLAIHADWPFEVVAGRFEIGKTLCYELYRSAVDDHHMQDLAELRKVLQRASSPGQPPVSPGLKRKR